MSDKAIQWLAIALVVAALIIAATMLYVNANPPTPPCEGHFDPWLGYCVP